MPRLDHARRVRECCRIAREFAAGYTIDEALTLAGNSRPATAVDTTDIAAALERPDSQRRFHVVESEREFIDVLNAPLARWRIFLHPSL